MSSFFLLNNFHFSLEILGALVFLVVAWLAFDASLIRRDFHTISRAIGFSFLVLGQILHALTLSSDIVGFLAYGTYIFGIIFILINLFLEAPIQRPEFKAILIVPGISAVMLPLNILVTIGLSFVAFLAYKQYKKELKKSLLFFWMAFLSLSLGSLSTVFYDPEFMSVLWTLGHIFEFVGFLLLALWVWKYLESRIREEILLIFVSLSLFIAIVVSLTFSSILLNRVEVETKANLLTNVKVLDFAISGLNEEALAKAKFIATNTLLAEGLLEDDFVSLQKLSEKLLKQEKLDFLIILDKEGGVILRAHALSRKGENLSDDSDVREALKGKSFVTIARSPVEGFSIRAASPVVVNGKLEGVIITGFQLDNIFADRIKKVTGLEMSIYDGNTRSATTLFNFDGLTRSVGIKQVDQRVLRSVLEEGTSNTLRTTILSRPFLASYLPLHNSSGEIVGMLEAAKSQHEILKTAQATNRLTLIIVIIIMLVLIVPIYLITRRLSKEMS